MKCIHTHIHTNLNIVITCRNVSVIMFVAGVWKKRTLLLTNNRSNVRRTLTHIHCTIFSYMILLNPATILMLLFVSSSDIYYMTLVLIRCRYGRCLFIWNLYSRLYMQFPAICYASLYVVKLHFGSAGV